MATNNAVNISAAGLVKYDGAGTFTGVTVTQHKVLIGGASNGITSLALTNGQLAIGNTGNDHERDTDNRRIHIEMFGTMYRTL